MGTVLSSENGMHGLRLTHAAVWLLWEEGNECGKKAKGVRLKLKGEVTDRDQSGGGGGGGGGGGRGGGGGEGNVAETKKKEADKHHTNVERAADWSLRLTIVDIMAGMESEVSAGGVGVGVGGRGGSGVISHNKHPLATTTKIVLKKKIIKKINGVEIEVWQKDSRHNKHPLVTITFFFF